MEYDRLYIRAISGLYLRLAGRSIRLGINRLESDMISSKIKDLRERKLFCLLEKSRIVDKFLFFNCLNKHSLDHKVSATIFSNLSRKSSSKVRIVRRCVLTNRNRGVLRPFGISRICLREMIQFGVIPGFSKAVW